MEIITYDEGKSSDINDLVALLSVLFNIEKDFNPDNYKQQKGLQLILENKVSATVQVARNKAGKVIGMVTAQLVISTAEGATSAWVEDMVIDAAYRGQGIGKKLLENIGTWAKNKGATRAQLLVDIENIDAIGYYEHLRWNSTQLYARRIFL